MASFYRLQQSSARDPIYSLFDAINHAQHEREKEIRSATKIQSIVKMKQQRTSFYRIVRAVIAVQRVFRGFCARKSTLRAMITREEHRQLQVYHYFATLIQSRFRGYISRKKGYDYYSQRRYIAGVIAKSDAVRREASEALGRQLGELAEQEATERRAAFEKTLAGKHHLLSTAAISGVYRPPLSVEGMGTVFGTNVEDEVRAHAAAEMRAQRKFKKDLPTAAGRSAAAAASSSSGDEPADDAGGAPSSSTAAAGGTTPLKASPPRGPKASSASGGMLAMAARGGATARLNQSAGGTAILRNGIPNSSVWGKGSLAAPPPQTLQSSTPYDMVDQQERHDRALNKAVLERIHGKGGFNVRKAAEAGFGGPTVNCETPYVDPKGPRQSTR